MTINFRKRLTKPTHERDTDPIVIYESLDRRSETGPLRPVQQEILREWHNERRNDRDVLIKLHTGQGKTLIGLLMSVSKMYETGKPALYLCANKHLAQQTIAEAKKFGIQCTSFGEGHGLPSGFEEATHVLVSHVQMLFNGRTRFGLGPKAAIPVAIVLDDAHACIESIMDCFTLKLQRSHSLYDKFLHKFGDDIKGQGEGTYHDILNAKPNSFLPLPYWSWIDRQDEIASLLAEECEDDAVKFVWPLIKDHLAACTAFISGNSLEIRPIHMPVELFGTFSRAGQRILMSATTQNDAFFIKGLSLTKDAILNPLTERNQKWSGEKLVLCPSQINDGHDSRDAILQLTQQDLKRRYGVVVIVPSFRLASEYRNNGSLVAESQSIDDIVANLRSGNYAQSVVFVNRYDGIDLPDNACRVLILDSLPYVDLLHDRYEEKCRSQSDLLQIKKAQKLEQGLGRAVRGEKDYCVILLVGSDLVKFIRSSTTNQYFSPQTAMQVKIGDEVAAMAREDSFNNDSLANVLKSILKQLIETRDDGWKSFYTESMDKVTTVPQNQKPLVIYEAEKAFEEAHFRGQHQQATMIVQRLLDSHSEWPISEKGWYLQQLARFTYLTSKNRSNQLQTAAYKANYDLLKPRQGVDYKKLENVDETQARRIATFIGNFHSREDLSLEIQNIAESLTFGAEADNFELAIQKTGEVLGFSSQRPEKEFKRGPDNLWAASSNEFFLFECKNEVDESRSSISKHESGQMNNSIGWFEEEYGPDVPVTYIMIIPTRRLSAQANFTKKVKILRKNGLNKLRDQMQAFYREFQQYEHGSVSQEKINELLTTHCLRRSDLKNLFEDYVSER